MLLDLDMSAQYAFAPPPGAVATTTHSTPTTCCAAAYADHDSERTIQSRPRSWFEHAYAQLDDVVEQPILAVQPVDLYSLAGWSFERYVANGVEEFGRLQRTVQSSAMGYCSGELAEHRSGTSESCQAPKPIVPSSGRGDGAIRVRW